MVSSRSKQGRRTSAAHPEIPDSKSEATHETLSQSNAVRPLASEMMKKIASFRALHLDFRKNKTRGTLLQPGQHDGVLDGTPRNYHVRKHSLPSRVSLH